jgi:menaquinone-dependent protoporphyrinogen oxidase
MDVLVGFVTEHGSTREIAERVAAVLSARGLAVRSEPLGPDLDPAGYEAYVLGSAIHSGDWLPEGGAFLRRHVSTLARRPVWLFSVSSVGERTSAFPPGIAARLRQVIRLPAAVTAVATLRPRDHHAFAGVVRAEHWGLAGRVFMTGLGGRYGDHRDWDEIGDWAEGIAAELTAREPAPAAQAVGPAA